MNPVKSLTAILGSLLVIFVLGQVLELGLVMGSSNQQLENIEQYNAVRAKTSVQAGLLIAHAVAALLGGYLTARVAGRREMQHAGVAAFVQTAALVWGFTAGEWAEFTPVWMRVALVLLTGPAMLMGASIRARAARSAT